MSCVRDCPLTSVPYHILPFESAEGDSCVRVSGVEVGTTQCFLSGKKSEHQVI